MLIYLLIISWFILGIASTLWLTLICDHDDVTVKSLFPIVLIGCFGYIPFVIVAMMVVKRWYNNLDDRVIFRNRWRQ